MQIIRRALSGTLTQSGNITIDVADDKTLTYSRYSAQPWCKHPDPELEAEALSNTNAFVLNRSPAANFC